jgi:F420-dependent oxidoreductase-like protein
VKVSLQIPQFQWQSSAASIGAKLSEIAQVADSVGFSSIWVMDHLFQIEVPGMWRADDPMLESYTTLGFLAGVTKQARLGALVTAATYREPGLLVKAVTALDVLSGGRAWLGIGAGWYEREASALGLPFPPLKERFERLEETLNIALKMWSGDSSGAGSREGSSPFHGKHYKLAEPINSPQAVTSPHPPILIGGGGEQKTLRLVAQYADACNFFPMPHDALTHKLDVLKMHCEAVGRDYDRIERTLLVPLNRPGGLVIPEIIDSCRQWADLGIQHIILSDPPDIEKITPLEVIGRELIPVVAEL